MKVDEETNTMNLYDKALIFARNAHGAIDHRRKYTGESYIVHPVEVSCIVAQVDDRPEILAACLLHDVLEDTLIKEAELRKEFGDCVTDLVVWLSNVSRPEDGNRAQRKEKDRLYLAQAPADAQTIKLADLISNTPSIVQYDKSFAKVYIPEKEALLKVLNRGDKFLWNQAYDLLVGAKLGLL